MYTLRKPIIHHKQEIQLCYGGYYDTKYYFTLQFQYFWDFNKCFQVIFSQLLFENFWLYLLSEVAMTQNY